jgi:hypothetical protein
MTQDRSKYRENGYDYENQCWVIAGIVQDCGHPENMKCNCYGRLHAGEQSARAEEGGSVESREAFEKAIREGRLAKNHQSRNYAGNYMYMGKRQGKDLFKNIFTKQYDV